MTRLLGFAMASGMMIGLAATAHGAALSVAGSPTYDPVTSTGLREGQVFVAPGWGVNNSGTAVGDANEYASGNGKGRRAVRWDSTGTAAMELDSLGTSSNDFTIAGAYAVNDAGLAVGFATKYVSGSSKGYRAVRWDTSGTAATELGDLGTDSSGYNDGTIAYAVNGAGTAVGRSQKYVSGIHKGDRAVRWDHSGTAATELDNLGTDISGYSDGAIAHAINDAGTAAGWGYKYISGSIKGTRAVRWDASGTAATELGDLGTDASGYTDAHAQAINDAGRVVGYSYKYVDSGYKGRRAVRWDGSGSTATELGNLGTDIGGSTIASACAVNGAGTAVGWAAKYVSGSNKGFRAVRWDASGTGATELGNLGTDSSGITANAAYAVNEAGTAVGYAEKYVNGSSLGYHAVIWLPDAIAIDLNDLGVAPVDASGTWMLKTAKALSTDGYVAGEGTFDPDGAGPLVGYGRLYVTQVGLGGNWTKAAGGTWGRGPNWSTGTPAMQVGNAVFNLNSTYTVAFDRDERTQTISVSAGTVTLNLAGHTLTTDNGLSIASSATLKGAGTIFGDITSAGTVGPGDGVGTLTIGGNLTSTGTLEFEIAGLSSYDEIDVSQTFNAGGIIAVSLLNGYIPAYGDRFHLMNLGSLTDRGYTFDLSQATLPVGLVWDASSFAMTGTIAVVPEPSTLALVGMGGIGLIAFGWRRRK
jgi:hypothetical protein